MTLHVLSLRVIHVVQVGLEKLYSPTRDRQPWAKQYGAMLLFITVLNFDLELYIDGKKSINFKLMGNLIRSLWSCWFFMCTLLNLKPNNYFPIQPSHSVNKYNRIII